MASQHQTPTYSKVTAGQGMSSSTPNPANREQAQAQGQGQGQGHGYKEPPCSLYTITQYQCTPLGGRVTCWPLERVFRQCGQGKPAIEVTNRLLPSSKTDESLAVDPRFIEKPPKARNWMDYRGP